MSFGAPWFLLALIVVPLAAGAYLLLDRRRRRAAAAFASPATMPSVVRSRPGWRRHAPMVVYALALIALALAFARPERTVAVPDGRAAVVLATDRSASMRATDVRPSRITAVRRAAKGFLDDVPRQVKVGSVAFNDRVTRIESPRLQRGAVRESIDALAAEGGTATGEAIAASMRSLERARGPRGKNPAAIILLSDGFSTSGRDPLEAAREARRKGIRVYTVSLGTATGTIDVERRDGTVRQRQVPPDTASLREIARITKGRAYRAGDRIKLEEVYERLGDQVGTRKEKRQVTSAFAGGALLLLGAGGLMSLRFFGRLP
ncbi:MAG TPA: VWA domain-containing protein [Thermoleophilaceae bacterium]|nr:VWA domain-containing protein [Thermoleophilaceae bacterium]